MEELPPRWVGARIKRLEDPRLLRGRGRFVADLKLPGMVEVAFVRSPHPHARVRGVNPTRAAELPGVLAVFTGAEVLALARPIRARYASPAFRETDFPVLAVDRVRFVGEAVAAVVAPDRYLAEDAAELVEVDYEPLAPVSDAEAALAADAPTLHDGVGSNVLFRAELRDGELEAAFRAADIVLGQAFRHRRQAGVPLETRGCLAAYDPAAESLTLWTSTQVPHLLRSALAELLSFPEHRLRVVAPDVGGGFGIKAQMFPEEAVVCLVARELGRPARWIEDRREHLLASIHAREQLHRYELAARADGTLLAIRAWVLSDAGAYSAYPFGAAQEAQGAMRNMAGPYKVSAYACEALGVATNKCPVGPYRGVARPVTTFVVDGMLDHLARALGLDPAEARRRNLVQPGEFPYRAASGFVYDSGSYVEALDQALRLSDYEGWRRRQRELRADGRYLGIGLACYAESSAWGSSGFNRRGVAGVAGFDQAVASIEPSGDVTLRVGVCGHGQGHATTLAQVLADELGVSPKRVRVIEGDTAQCPYGMGTFASRSAVVGGGSTMLAGRELREKLLRIAAHALEADRRDLVLRDGRVTVRGAPARSLSLEEIARLAYFWPSHLPPGLAPGLEARAVYDPPEPTFSNGTHVAMVEVDAETGQVELLRYVVVEDCGPIINPTIVEGQIHGAVAQGIGGGLYEELAYDASGQALTTSLMDYLIPTACEVPALVTSHLETPSPFTPGGRKGMGEGGTIAAHAALANAVADALAPLGVAVHELPLGPDRLWRLITLAARGA